jgi:hypothetical protein
MRRNSVLMYKSSGRWTGSCVLERLNPQYRIWLEILAEGHGVSVPTPIIAMM